MYKKYFCTFADSRMKKSLLRLEIQAQDLNFFDKIFINNENNLDPDFSKYFKSKLIKGSRGYGYWSWKPQIILQTFREMNEGDILLYLDAGCHLNKNGLDRLNYYFNQTELSESGLFAFQEALRPEDSNLEVCFSHLEKYFTKGDIFDYFKVRDREDVYNTGIIAGGIFLVKKCTSSQEIIEQWLDVFKHHFDLVDNSPSRSSNFDGFIENRHDQSIFSILCKQKKIPTVSIYETWQPDWSRLEYYPILAKRDKGLGIFWKTRLKILSVIYEYLNIRF